MTGDGQGSLEGSIVDLVLRRQSAVVLGVPGIGLSTLLQRVMAGVRDGGRPTSFVRFPDPRFGSGTTPTLDTDTVLLVDDAHRATELQQLTVRDLAIAGPVVIGARCGALPESLTWLWRSGVAQRFELEPLGAAAVERFVEGHLGGPVHATLIAGIMKRTQGRPGFVADEIELLRVSGVTQEAGFLRDRPIAHRPIRVAERAQGVLDELPVEVARAVQAIAMAGHLPAPSLSRYGVEVHELVRRGLADPIGETQSSGPTAIRLVPPALAVGVRETLTSVEAAQLADELLERDGRSLPDEDRARLRLDLGRPLDLGEISAAAWSAIARRSLSDAAALARTAMAYGPSGMLAAAEIFTNVGNRAEAARCFAGLLDDPAADPIVRVRAATEYASSLLWDLGRPDEAVRIAADLTSSAQGGPWAAAATIHETAMLMYSGRSVEAIGLLDGVERAALDEQWRRVHDLVRLVTISFVRGPAPDDDLVESLTLVTDVRLGDTFGPAVGVIAVQLAFELAGDWHRASDVVMRARRDLRLDGTPLSAAWMALAQARAALGTGELDGATRAATEAADCFADINHPSGLRWAVGAALLAAAQSGDLEACRALAARFEALAPGAPFLDADLERARAWAACALGDSAVAIRHFEAAASTAAAMGSPVLEAAALHDAYRAVRAPVGSRLDELLRMCSAPSVELRARHVRLSAAEEPGDLLALAIELESRGAMLLAAEVASDAAAMAAGQGRRSIAREADGLCARLVARCGTVSTPRLAGRQAGALTNRERDIATLAAAGRASKAIADELGLSVRTVDNVLQRVYIKLGIHGRADLAGRVAVMPAAGDPPA